MDTPHFTPLQIGLHWLTALLVLLIIALPYGNDLFFEALLGGKGAVFTLHKSLGLTVLALTVLRLSLRRRAVGASTFAAKAGHALLYLLLLMMPISGLLFGGKPFSLFWLVDVGPLPFSKGVREVAKEVHLIGQYVLFAMIIGHTCMALWHHYVRRDGVLKAMLP